MLRNFQFNAISRGNKRHNLPYKKRLDETHSGDSVCISYHQKLCHFATGTFASEHRHFSNNNLYFTQYLFRTSCNITSSNNKSRSYLHIIVSCCWLEFQFLSVPTHSRLPSRSTRSTFYVPNPPSTLGYNTSCEAILKENNSLTCQTSVPDFFRSSLGTRASVPAPLDNGD